MKRKDLIIANIKAALSEKNISQRRFADLLNKNEAEISRWLSGHVGISANNIIAINEVLGIDVTLSSDANVASKDRENQPRQLMTVAPSDKPPSRISSQPINSRPLLARKVSTSFRI